MIIISSIITVISSIILFVIIISLIRENKKQHILINEIVQGYYNCYKAYHNTTLITFLMFLKDFKNEDDKASVKQSLINAGADPNRLNSDEDIIRYIVELTDFKG